LASQIAANWPMIVLLMAATRRDRLAAMLTGHHGEGQGRIA
jgi:hypothetical protein